MISSPENDVTCCLSAPPVPQGFKSPSWDPLGIASQPKALAPANGEFEGGASPPQSLAAPLFASHLFSPSPIFSSLFVSLFLCLLALFSFCVCLCISIFVHPVSLSASQSLCVLCVYGVTWYLFSLLLCISDSFGLLPIALCSHLIQSYLHHSIKPCTRSGPVAHAYNPSTLGG